MLREQLGYPLVLIFLLSYLLLTLHQLLLKLISEILEFIKIHLLLIILFIQLVDLGLHPGHLILLFFNRSYLLLDYVVRHQFIFLSDFHALLLVYCELICLHFQLLGQIVDAVFQDVAFWTQLDCGIVRLWNLRHFFQLRFQPVYHLIFLLEINYILSILCQLFNTCEVDDLLHKFAIFSF